MDIVEIVFICKYMYAVYIYTIFFSFLRSKMEKEGNYSTHQLG